MIRKKQALLLGASTLALMSFAFTAGYGLRELAVLAQGAPSRWVFTSGPGAPRSLGLIASRNGAAAGNERDLGAGQVFYEVLDQLQQQSVEKLPPDTVLATGAVDAMLDRLNDVNTRFLEPDEAAALKSMRTGVFPGLGAVLAIRRTTKSDGSAERNITVVTPMPGSPAEKAGLQPGDRITEIDGRWIAPARLSPRVLNRITEEVGPYFTPQPGKDLVPKDDEERPKPTVDEEKQRKEAAETERKKWRNSTDLASVLRQLTVQTSGKHTLTVERAGEEKPRTVSVTLAHTEVPPVTSRMQGDGVAYIRLNQVSAAAAQAFGTALTELQGKGARSLILDLRRSPGGTLVHAQEIAGRLMSTGNLAIVQRRNGARKPVKQPLAVKPAAKPSRFRSIVVLVDRGTAGASEALAAGLRDSGTAKLIGEQTFGDGTEQTLFPLDNGAALSITTAKMLSPKEIDYDGKGLKPDVAVPATGAGEDRPLEQALRAVRAS
jgi:carboxyl-terminal processing protease